MDKFTISYSIWIGMWLLLFAFSHDLDRIFKLYLLLVPLMVLPAIGVAIAWLISLIRNIALRRWRRVASVIAAPFIVVSVFALLGQLGINPARIRLELGRPYYLDQIAQLPKTDEPRFQNFDWGETGGVAVANIFARLVFDESDEIALPPGQRSAAWWIRTSRLCNNSCPYLTTPEDARHSIEIKNIQGHFYLVTEVYQ